MAKPTLKDVADRAGVSTATVSRVMNTSGIVQPATRDRVQAAIRELGYTPNFGARALASRRTNTVAAIVPTLENAIFARGLEAFQDELSSSGVTLLVASNRYDPEIESAQVRKLVARGADAILLIGFDRSPEIYEFLRRSGTPFAIAWAHDPAQQLPSVGFDNRLAMKRLAERVLALGHRRLGMITAHRQENDRARYRWLGILDALAERGLPERALVIFETSYAVDEGRAGFRALMSQTGPPTAILCGNDVLAAGAVLEARFRGLRIPEDISITGFDDIEIAEILSPPLTTVHVPHRRMGRDSARLLLAMLTGAETGPSQAIDTEIVMRGTLGPPREARASQP